MAKVRLLPSDIDERTLTHYGKRPSFRGAVVYYLSRSGVAAMVRPYSVPGKTWRQRMVWEWMRYTNLVWKLTDRLLVQQYIEQSKGFWILPRDIFFAAQAGRLVAFDDVDTGVSYFPVRHRDDMSRALDVFVQVPGGILFRGVDGWSGLSPGLPGQILMISADGLPAWSDLPSGDGQVRSFTWSENMLGTYAQGAGTFTLPDGRRAITLAGTATSTVYFGGRLAWPSSVLSYKACIAKTSSSGGDTRMGVAFRVYDHNGNMVWEYEENKTAPFPAEDSNQVFEGGFSLPSYVFSSSVPYSFQLRVIRFGASPMDTSNFNTYLWRVDLNLVE